MEDSQLNIIVQDKWQKLLDQLSLITNTPNTLIMRVQGEWIEVFSKSSHIDNRYSIHAKDKLSGLYCEEVIERNNRFYIPDAYKTERWKNNPKIEFGLNSYVGYPVHYSDGNVFGTICFLDYKSLSDFSKYEGLIQKIIAIVELDIEYYFEFRKREVEKQNELNLYLAEEYNVESDHFSPVNKLSSINNKQDHLICSNIIKETETKYKYLIESIGNPFMLLSPIKDYKDDIIDSYIIDINKAAADIIGVDKECLKNSRFSDQFDYLIKGILEIVQPKFRLRKSHSFEYYIRNRDMYLEISTFFTKESEIIVLFKDISDRVKLRNDLRSSEQHYRSLFEKINVGVESLQPVYTDGKIVDFILKDVNPIAAKLYNIDKTKHLNKLFTEIFKNRTGQIINLIQESNVCNKPKELEIFDCEINKYLACKIFKDGDTDIILTYHDISDRIFQLQSLKESESRLKSIFEHDITIMLVLDPDTGMIVDCNNAATKFYGYSRNTLLNSNIHNINTETVDRTKECLCRVVKKGSSYFEFKHKVSSGEIKEVEVHSCPFRRKGKTLILSIIHDATEKNRALKDVYTMSEIVKQAPISITITDNIGNITYVNKYNEKLTGYKSNEIIGLNPSVLKSGKISMGEYQILWSNLMNKNTWSGELYNKKKNGDFYWEHALIGPILNEKNEVTNYFKISEDISKRKKMELDLRYAKLRAEESERLKTSFLSNLSHEIRTPLNGIIGFSKLLEIDELSPEKKNMYVDVINKSGNQLAQIINDLVNTSMIEAGKINIKISSFVLESLIDEIVSYHSKHFTHKGIELISTIEAESDTVWNTDKKRLRQVIDNLLRNALKYTNNGKVEIKMERFDNHIKFSVIDTGIGIEEKNQKLIFNRFRKIEKKETNNDGNGLGLYICKEIVRLLGGEIWVKSKLGEGTEISFTIMQHSKLSEE
ncbi:MAG: PAS domain S-box protein [Marinifilaceae bacterium]|jgi:PAS domain S-box-containing protein|nr:PAS domain S-box protein [Marinifilaceae bacterium]